MRQPLLHLLVLLRQVKGTEVTAPTPGPVVTVTKVPTPTGTDMERVHAEWPDDGHGNWYVWIEGDDHEYATRAELASKPRWSHQMFLGTGRYVLHVEGFDPVPFEVTR